MREVRTIEATPYQLAQDLLCLGGEPFSLKDYPYLEAVYNTRAPRVGLFTARQCSKSTTLSSKLVLNAVCHPGCVQVYVAPLQEQAMVFAQQRLRDFISGSPIIRDCFFEGPGKVDQVLRRVFNAGNSMITLGYAQRTADRLRGQSLKDGKMHQVLNPTTGELIEVGGAQLTFDECLASGTQVDTPEGSTSIEDLQVGDIVYAFTTGGEIAFDYVQDIMYKGRRPTYLVEFDNGQQLRCTANEKFYTSDGWKFLSDLADLEGVADSARDIAGGQFTELPGSTVFAQPEAVVQSQHGSAVVGSLEGHESSDPPGAGERDRERGVWVPALAVPLHLPPGSGACLQAVLPGGTEDTELRLARPNRTPWTSDLVHGRREPTGRLDTVAYGRLWAGRQPATGTVVLEARGCVKVGALSNVCLYSLQHSRDPGAPENNLPLHARVGGLQVRPLGNEATQTEPAPCDPSGGSRSPQLGLRAVGCRVGRTCQAEDGIPRASGIPNPPTTASCLTPRRIVRVTVAEPTDVWDITTAATHTFFANGIAVHNCQDTLPDIYPVVEEMAFRVKAPRFWYCGTPKSMNNHMEALRARSTGAEWAVRCTATGCKKWNHSWTERNIGDHGVICEFCGAALNTNAGGRWVVARKMDLDKGRNASVTMETYRVPQLIVKPVMDRKTKWLELLDKLRNYSTEKFRNEVLGLPHDSGSVPVTLEQLKACSDPDRPNEVPNPRKRRYPPLVMGVDWAFNGENSYTFVTIGGFNPFPGRFDVYYWKIFKGVETDPLYQIDWIVKAAHFAGVQLLGCDWGCGQVQNLQLINRLGDDRVIQMWHTGMQGTGAGRAARVKWDPKVRKWHLARTRVLTDVFEMVRTKQISFPKSMECQELFDHFMAVSLEYNDKTNVQRYVNIKPDDGLHSVCYSTIAGEFLVRGDFKGHMGSTTQSEASAQDVWNETPDAQTDSLYR